VFGAFPFKFWSFFWMIKEFLTFVEGNLFNDQNLKGKAPNTVFPALKNVLYSIIVLAIYILLSGKYPVAHLATVYYDSSYLVQLGYLLFSMFVLRCRYYFAWTYSEGSFIASGFGYNGVDANKNIKFNRLSNVSIPGCEFAVSIRDYVNNWNKNTADFLKHYVYFRVMAKNSKDNLKPTVATFVASAIWHGLYPGYYMFFVGCAIATEVAKDMRKLLNYRFSIYQPYYDIVTIITTQFFVNYLALGFCILDPRISTRIYSNCYWVPHIILVSALIFFRFTSQGRNLIRNAGPKKSS